MQWRDRLRQAVDESGLLQKELAARAGIEANTLNGILKNPDRDPAVSNVVPVARVLGISLDELFSEGDAPLPPTRLTPYDTDPQIRAAADALVPLTDRDRRETVRWLKWIAGALSKSPSAESREGRDLSAGDTPTSRERPSLTSALLGAPEEGDHASGLGAKGIKDGSERAAVGSGRGRKDRPK